MKQTIRGKGTDPVSGLWTLERPVAIDPAGLNSASSRLDKSPGAN